ncbi:SAM-dependent methyltransferase [Geomonas limicola]|uniref:SAM-dependent methyltransferase n=1 Tax=Geomonas limicola TaxID=2740186 RepID=A0A6V8N3Y3_9BACT|nr:class I SAM-dependent methyltransferase [Geomonas limicola]GFO67258.1 SAM-dependent methyltransferase [Geomonas limicola]
MSDDKPIGAGKSSFELIDFQALLAELPLTEDTCLLDLACGAGAYTLALAERLGKEAELFAYDLWAEGIELLNREIETRQIKQVQAGVADVTQSIPLEDGCVDVCLMATVLHDFIAVKAERGVLGELARVVRTGGTLAVVEFKVLDGPPGPPRGVRITPETVQELVTSYGFRCTGTKDLGPYNYLSLFERIA